MNTKFFIEKAKEKGFDTVAALSLDEAEQTIAGWNTRSEGVGLMFGLTLNPREIMPEAACVLVLAYPYRTYTGYPPETGFVSGYYIASNLAHHACNELIEYLRSQGIRAESASKLPQKALANAAGLGRYGRSGIIVRRGSHIALASILADAKVQLPPVRTPVPDCDNCKRCEAACPTGCLKDGLVQIDRCLRTYMTGDRFIPTGDMAELMGERLLGCDDCLNACPGVKQDPVPAQFGDIFAWDALADADTFEKNRESIAGLIGTNYANAVHKAALRRLIPPAENP